jgi:hypothetical protein
MPNWCANTLNVFGDKADLEAFQQFMETEKSRFDFNAILPQPKELEGIHSGNTTIDGVRYNLWREVDGREVGIKPDQELQLIALCGASNWYDWNIANWGTKWNNSDDGVHVDMISDSNLLYNFDTAWSPPIPVVEALVENFPKLNFLLDFEEPGMSFWGEMEWQNGDLVNQMEGEMDYDEENEEFIRL